VNLAAGAEWRDEQYGVRAGDRAGWTIGPYAAQGFMGGSTRPPRSASRSGSASSSTPSGRPASSVSRLVVDDRMLAPLRDTERRDAALRQRGHGARSMLAHHHQRL